ncbi:hypothetical protein [Flavimaricola marinus]|uniref:Uncharacterized protein n=1 Tax=Flavimaricola marinus TaxID=1819565 RepID=A0A238LE68_9RHOB|nr:hypothetical protein [Flavimaricola marinus]SMY07918.1 hypothetical protein LOM8899_02063 [Flavimaricola marinus]
MWKIVGLASLALVPAQAEGSQPIKESLVECAVLIEALLGPDLPPPGENPQFDLYVEFETALRDEAVQLGGQAYVDEMAVAKLATWETRWDEGDWDNPANRGELADWMSYCTSLADHLQL